jgi:Big-like domain-containing protein
MGGQTTSTNFPLMNPLQSKLTGVQNGWVSIMNAPVLSTGPAATLAFSTYIGGSLAKFGAMSTNEAIQGVAVDGAHTIYAHGRTLSDNFFANTTPTTVVNGFQKTCSSCSPTHVSPNDDAVVFVLPNPTAVATTTTLASSLNPSTFGQPVTFTATVKATSGTAIGTVTFKDGSKALGSVALLAGVAKFIAKSLSVGTHSITAVYAGNVNFAGSTSAVLKQTVNQAGTSTSLVSTPNPSTVGQTVTFTATVKAATSGTPTGTVTFKDGATNIGTGALSAGKATFKTSKLAKGIHSITAVYGGSTSYLGSTSPVLKQTVN